MAARKRGARAARPAIERALVLVGAVRPAPLAVEDAGQRYTPEIAVVRDRVVASPRRPDGAFPLLP